MAPSKFEIYVDQTATIQAAPQQPEWPRYIKENLDAKNQMFYFDERKIYPVHGGELSFEELNLASWVKRQHDLKQKEHIARLERENEELKRDIALYLLQLDQQREQLKQPAQLVPPEPKPTNPDLQRQAQSPPSHNRLSIVPQSLQPAQGGDTDTCCYGVFNEAPSLVHDPWKNTMPVDRELASIKFTVPIDQSQYIRENYPTSTPTNKEDKAKRAVNRRMSRPSMGGSPTMKLSPITETSRDCNSKSSSSSSAMSTTPGNACKRPLVLEPVMIDEPDRPLDPNDPTTYRKLLKVLAEPLERRSSYVRLKEHMPLIRTGEACGDGTFKYLIHKELSSEAKIFRAQLLDESDSSNSELPDKDVCLRVDQPSNDWLFYICDELHKRLVRQKTKPDIELSVMNADPAIIYINGSILVDEYFRFFPLDDYFSACAHEKKPFPKPVAAYITLELIQLIRGLHSCNIVHMNVCPKNIIITSCPSREDIASVNERTSIVKLIGFDHAIDTQLVSGDFRFNSPVDYMNTGGVLDSRPWCHEIDWIGLLNCVHKMFFSEELVPIKDGDRWIVQKQFKGFPTVSKDSVVWASTFEGLLNIRDAETTNDLLDRVVDELSAWIKANINSVLREFTKLDASLENYCIAANKSVGV